MEGTTNDPAWAALEDRIRNHIQRQGFSAHVGAEVESLAPGACTTSVTRRPELLQNMGYFHGGLIAYLVDNAAAIAASTLLREGQVVLTSEFKLNYLAPARGDKLLCRARVLKPGRSMTVVSADVYSVEDGVERHAATALATIAIVTRPG
jgi:uncharacterized protein (TIGR00369 family)